MQCLIYPLGSPRVDSVRPIAAYLPKIICGVTFCATWCFGVYKIIQVPTHGINLVLKLLVVPIDYRILNRHNLEILSLILESRTLKACC